MAVEIYLEPELEEMIQNPEVEAEWKSLVEELGLEGQSKLIAQRESTGEDKKASPYIHLNKKYANVFSVLCPEVVDYKKYDKTTIPREVLKEIALCEKEGYFDHIRIWYDDASPDPFVIGYIKDGSYSWIRHIIARFGDELLPFEILEEKAYNRLKKNIKSQLENSLAAIDTHVNNLINPGGYGSDQFTIQVNTDTYNHRHG